MRTFGVFRIGIVVLPTLVACDAGEPGRPQPGRVPVVGDDENDPVTHIEGLDLGPVLEHLQNNAQPVPEAEPEPGDAPGPDGGTESGGGTDGGDAECGFECVDGTCIDASWRCDAWFDCAQGEDESTCGAAPPGLPFAQSPDAAALDTACVAEFGVAGGAAGSVAGEGAFEVCKRVGSRIPGYGFAAAVVCYPGDWIGADNFLGSLLGIAAGTLAGATVCEGGALDQVAAAYDYLFGAGDVPTIVVESRRFEVAGLGEDALTCTGAYTETAYHDDSACGDDVYSLTCRAGAATESRCRQWQETANRNLVCHWARIVAGNTKWGGQLDANHLDPILRARENHDDCAGLILDNCREEDDPIDDAEAQQRAMDLVCR